jgi:hypothetical protein
MSPAVKDLLKQAMTLEANERAELADELLSSLDCPAQAEIDALWAREAEDRVAAFDRGELESRPAEEVFNRILSTIRENED